MRRAAIPALALLLGSAACHYTPARFRARSAVQNADDERPIPVPRRSPFVEAFYLSDVYLRRPVVDALDAERFPYARDVNALDEVPRSSWFSPVPLEPDAFLARYAADGPPRPPVRIEGSGRFRRLFDARGLGYRIIEDHPTLPAVDTAASVIASRLVRALGYRTPETWLVEPRSLGLRANTDRWTLVRWPLGAALGPTDMTYRRDDDPNDRVAHRDRRTLRALGVLGAWLDLRELGPSRLVDVYVGRPGRGHVEHLLVGLEDALGAAALAPSHAHAKTQGAVGGNTLENLLTLGLGEANPRAPSRERSLVAFPASLPARYELGHPYEPVDRLLPSDGYWIAKRMCAIPSALIERAVADAKLPAPIQSHVVHALEARRRTLAGYQLSLVTPLEVESVVGRRLVLSDGAIACRLVNEAESRYEIAFLDDSGRTLAPSVHARPLLGELELVVPELEAGYLVVRVRVERPGQAPARWFEAHFTSRSGALTLVGVRH
ncbi:MAG: hypothetical protein U0263_37175 [Polyangiaceae bacterium]